ncbi:type VI secretion system-associated protein TagF [Arenibacterium halophilum]|uniref:Type VI secretion system-associated protein TagF n=2 Tax=Arenibacterium halophilum TaxID=2583821 RepID=A0ABY2X7N4_9RHOB|nr:type VI secretion system-associated protein TagF [Arenibacterium halophilum]
MAAMFGAFGKMPSVGDFFRINLGPGFVTPWDTWIQQVMLGAQGVFGNRFDAYYMSAPIWRFSLSAGLAGPQKMLGVLMPSVDRVGRRFPLTLAAPMDTPGSAPLDHFREETLFAQLETLALSALGDDMTREGLAERLGDLPAMPLRGAAPLRAHAGAMVLTGAGEGGFLPDLASGLLAGKYSAPTMWSAVVNDVTRVMICDGLPNDTKGCALFDLDAPLWTEAGAP